MTIKAIAVALAFAGAASGAGYYAGTTAVAVATCSVPQAAPAGMMPQFTPMPMTGNQRF